MEEEIKKEFDIWYKSQKEMNPYIMRDWFINKLKTHTIKLLKAEIERLEGKLKLKSLISKEEIPQAEWRGYAQCIKNQISHLQEQIIKIKEIK